MARRARDEFTLWPGAPSSLVVGGAIILWLAAGVFADVQMTRAGGGRATPLHFVTASIPMFAGAIVLVVLFSQAAKTLEQKNVQLVQAERAAAGLAAELDTIIQSLPLLLIVTDRQGRLARTNGYHGAKAVTHWLGRTVEELYRTGELRPICHEDGIPLAKEEYPHLRALTGETVEAELVMMKRPGKEPAYYLVSASPISDPETGGTSGSVMLVRDFSSFKRLDRLKDEFLFTASHELRTPLAVIRGYAELSIAALKKEQQDGRRVGDETTDLALSRIITEVDGMVALLEQMLQIARIDTERLQLNLVDQDLVELTAAEIGLFSIKQEYARVILDRGNMARHPVCRLDRVAFRQILANLVSNAIKYSPDGAPVVVQVSLEAGEGVLSVLDRGSGIPEDEIPLIFEKFYRSPNAIQSGAAGLGLGLYITGRLVELLNGRIKVESRPGEGTAFRVAFPISRTA